MQIFSDSGLQRWYQNYIKDTTEGVGNSKNRQVYAKIFPKTTPICAIMTTEGVVSSLTNMLKLNPTFQNLPYEEQMVLARLATEFETKTDFLYLSPEELTAFTQLGNRFQWAKLLNMEATRGYIKSQMAQITEVLQRKTMLDLQKQAQTGNVQAIKQINELSGIMSQEDTNRTIILHQIVRPEIKTQTPKEAKPTDAQVLQEN